MEFHIVLLLYAIILLLLLYAIILRPSTFNEMFLLYTLYLCIYVGLLPTYKIIILCAMHHDQNIHRSSFKATNGNVYWAVPIPTSWAHALVSISWMANSWVTAEAYQKFQMQW